MRTQRENKEGFREAQLCYLSHAEFKLMRPIYVNNGRYKNGTVLSRLLGERQRKVQSAVRETSWPFLVARADVRSGVQTRWLRFTLIVYHILPSSQMFICLRRCQGLLNQKVSIHKSQSISAKVRKC